MPSLLFALMTLAAPLTDALSLFKNEILTQHNTHVQYDDIPHMNPLSWNDALTKQADEYIQSCNINPSSIYNTQSHQPNILIIVMDKQEIPIFDLISNALNSWFSEHQYLNMIQPQTKHVGCAIGICNDQMLLVCAYGPQSKTTHDEHTIKRRNLVQRLSTEDGECCYHYITEYLITISVSFQIFDDKTHVPFENYSDSTVSQILPLILYQLVLDKEIEHVTNFSISADQVTSSEYTYYVDLTTDSNSHMVRFRTYTAHELYSDYTEQYENVSLLAIMLQSSIGFDSSSQEQLVYIEARNGTETSDSEDGRSDGLISDDGINYEILNEWYFILILLVSVVGIVICVAVLVKHYYSGSGYDTVELIEQGLRNNDGGHRISVASCSSSHSAGGYDRSMACDEMERLSHHSHINPVHSDSDDETSLLNADDGEEVQPDTYLSYNPHYGL
eukprot:21637_1